MVWVSKALIETPKPTRNEVGAGMTSAARVSIIGYQRAIHDTCMEAEKDTHLSHLS